MQQTHRTARRVFNDVFTFDGISCGTLRGKLVGPFRQMRVLGEQPAEPSCFLQKQGLKRRFGGLLLLQFCQPMEATGVQVELNR
jgi:hypothetical protein